MKRFILQFFCISAYIKATAALCIITLITDVIATILTGFGLKSQNHNLKYKFYRIAVLVMLLSCKKSKQNSRTGTYSCVFVSVLAVLTALILYPVCFAAELNLGKLEIQKSLKVNNSVVLYRNLNYPYPIATALIQGLSKLNA